MTATIKRYGRVMIRAGWVGDRWQYKSVLVREYTDGDIEYYHGGPTCNTADGWVALPEKYRERWDE